MPKKTDDEIGAAIFRDIENRIVWVAAFLVNRGTSKGLNSACAKAAGSTSTSSGSRRSCRRSDEGA